MTFRSLSYMAFFVAISSRSVARSCMLSESSPDVNLVISLISTIHGFWNQKSDCNIKRIKLFPRNTIRIPLNGNTVLIVLINLDYQKEMISQWRQVANKK